MELIPASKAAEIITEVNNQKFKELKAEINKQVALGDLCIVVTFDITRQQIREIRRMGYRIYFTTFHIYQIEMPRRLGLLSFFDKLFNR